MKLDTELDGWEMVFKPWEQSAINAIYKYPAGITSATLKREVNEVSRASCINFLEAMVENGFLKKVERTGKGGFHGVYSPVYPSKESFEQVVIKKFLDSLRLLQGVSI